MVQQNMTYDQRILMREYADGRAYQQDLSVLPKAGWQVVSTLERRPKPNLLHYLTFGLSTWANGPERLVTYARVTTAQANSTASSPANRPDRAMPIPPVAAQRARHSAETPLSG